MFENIKSALRDDRSYLAVVVVLVAITAFGLGRVSVQAPATAQAPAAVSLRPEPVVLPVDIPVASEAAEEATYVASKNGTKYHLTTCPGAKQITEANKIWFDSAVDAAAAGYTPAANCPGL